MENIAVSRLMRIINSLAVDKKLELLSKLSESLKIDFHSKEKDKLKLLEELSGAWSEMDENLADDIKKARTNSDKNISFD